MLRRLIPTFRVRVGEDPHMRSLVLGGDGLVGFECAAALRLFSEVVSLSKGQLDITNHGELSRMLQLVRPDVVVNAAAFTDVTAAETNVELARAVNAFAVGVLGEEAKRLRFGIVHFSTDYVFDGRKGSPYVETDAPSPISVYGQTKLDGERALQELGAPAVILRTSWLYGFRKKCFVTEILRLAREQRVVRVVGDQSGNPTSARELAIVVALLLNGMGCGGFEGIRDMSGVYHIAGRGMCSRYELAEAAISIDPRRKEHVLRKLERLVVGGSIGETAKRHTSSAVPMSIRPLAVDLDCAKAWSRFGLRLPHWTESLSRALGERANFV